MLNSIDNRFANNPSFYEELKAFKDFTDITTTTHYTPLPNGWIIVKANIQESIKAINDGRYKDMNMAGAGCIVAVLNVTRGYEIPFIFGGNSATLAIPKEILPRVKDALLGTQFIFQTKLNLDLKISAIPIEDIREKNLDVLVAKHQLSKGNFLAVFSGGGVGQIDCLIKQASLTKNYNFTPKYNSNKTADLNRLSCRWAPLKSRHGQILSLLVQVAPNRKQNENSIYDKVMTAITEILGQDILAASPVHPENLSFTWPPEGLNSEILATTKSSFKLHKESLIQWILEKFNFPSNQYSTPNYRQELSANSNYCRFDDRLCLILDCTEQQVNEIDSFLSNLHHDKDIVYGIHTADNALITCLLLNLKQGEHLHFINGADGGSTLAATQLKAQLKRLE